jgi:acetyl esterase/lipase
LNQIAIIYAALASGNTGPELGFDVNSIIVTGESAGGNLAAALCVKLAMHNIGVGPEDVDIDDTSSSSSSSSSSPILIDDNAEKLHRMPDAIMPKIRCFPMH